MNCEISDADMQILVTLLVTLISIHEVINSTKFVKQNKYLEHMFVFNMGLKITDTLLTDTAFVFGRGEHGIQARRLRR